MSDRLEEIKRWHHESPFICARCDWLIAEVERMRVNNLVDRMRVGITATEGENARLRVALQTLYDLHSNIAEADSDALTHAWAAAESVLQGGNEQ